MKFTDTIKTKLGLKPRKDISTENLKAIATMIKEEHADWAMLNDEILIMLLKFTILQFPPDQFDNMTEQELREKIRNAFINATKTHKSLKEIASPYEIMRLNAAYDQGKHMGVKGKTMLNAIFKQLKKTIPTKENIDAPVIIEPDTQKSIKSTLTHVNIKQIDGNLSHTTNKIDEITNDHDN